MIRFLRNALEETLADLREDISGYFTFITGALAYEEIKNTAELIMKKNNNLVIDVKKVLNKRFGETITVAGLLTGKDIINQIKGDLGPGKVIIPVNMLRSGEDVFLDDVTLQEMKEEIGRDIVVCEYTGEDLIEIINNNW